MIRAQNYEILKIYTLFCRYYLIFNFMPVLEIVRLPYEKNHLISIWCKSQNGNNNCIFLVSCMSGFVLGAFVVFWPIIVGRQVCLALRILTPARDTTAPLRC